MTTVPVFSKAEMAYDYFCAAKQMQTIISSFNRLCDLLNINPAQDTTLFYRKIRKKLSHYWKAHSLFCKLDKRVLQKEYKKQLSAYKYRVLVLGAGPAGLRFAIEMALLGAKVVVIEKRPSFSRNNVLHLWPFIIQDLNALGAKKFFGKFCAGDIDHISIQTLQCILLKICLIFGVQVHPSTEFRGIVEPSKLPNGETSGWRVKLSEPHHVLCNYEFDVLIGANGKQCTLEGFKRKEFRGRLAIAITANFVNNNTEAEVRVKEISGVAYIFNQKFFKDLYATAKIDLENIVYYKNETHYFVMTAKKSSLLFKGVLKNDFDKSQQLLHPSNIDQEALKAYALEAANFSTNNEMPDLKYATTPRGEADIALFDFTSLFQAEHSTRVIQRCGQQLILGLVGDALLEPFWPTGSGCARAFLAAIDTSWMIKRLGSDNYHILEALAERESIYQRLSQTTPQNLFKTLAKYTLDPSTRYPSLNVTYFKPDQMLHLVDTDDTSFSYCPLPPLPSSPSSNPGKLFKPRKQSLPNLSLSIVSPPISSSGRDSLIEVLEHQLPANCQMLRWFQVKLDAYSDRGLEIVDLFESWCSGLAFLCILYAFRPHLVDLNKLCQNSPLENIEKVFHLFQQEFRIEPPCSATELISNEDQMLSYLHQIHSCLKLENNNKENIPPGGPTLMDSRSSNKRRGSKSHHHHFNPFHKEISYNLKKNGAVINNEISRQTLADTKEKRKEKTQSKVELKNIRLISQPSDKITGLHQKLFGMAHNSNPNLSNRRTDDTIDGVDGQGSSTDAGGAASLVLTDRGRDRCALCGGRLIYDESQSAAGYVFHAECFRCAQCDIRLCRSTFTLFVDREGKEYFYCSAHYKDKMKVRENSASNNPDPNEEKTIHKLSTPVRRLSSIQRRPAFHVSTASDKDEEIRSRTVSEPVKIQEMELSNISSNPGKSVGPPGVSSQDISENLGRRLNWEDIVAKCRAQRSSSTDDSISPVSETPDASSSSNTPQLPPRTVFLNEEFVSGHHVTNPPPPIMSEMLPKFIVIGGNERNNSFLSDITECPSVFERSQKDGTLLQSTLTSVTESPELGTLSRETDTSGTLRSDRTDSLQTTADNQISFNAESSRKKLKPLQTFDSLMRDIRDFETDADDEYSKHDLSPPIEEHPYMESDWNRGIASSSFVGRPLDGKHRFTSLSSEMLNQFDPAYDEDSDHSATLSYNKNTTFGDPFKSEMRNQCDNSNDRMRSSVSTPDLSSILLSENVSIGSGENKLKHSNKHSSQLKKKISADSPGKPKGLLRGLFRRNRKKSDVLHSDGTPSETTPDDSVKSSKSSKKSRGLKKFKSDTNLSENPRIYSADSSLNLTLSPLSSGRSCDSSCNDLTIDQINASNDFSPETVQGQKNLELYRLRQAQEIQRQLQEVEVHLAELELRNGDLQNRMHKVDYLRQQKMDHQSNPELEDIDRMEKAIYNEIVIIVAEKNQLVRFENDLTMEAKQLELEDSQTRLDREYRRRLAIPDYQKSDEMRQEDKRVLHEYLSVVHERNSLVDLQHEQKKREAVEDARLLEALDKRGIHILPTSYVTKIQMGCNQESGLI